MALVYADRVKETSTTTGTGTLTLAGAETGYQAFTDALDDADTCHYTITDGYDWEVGLGTFTASGTTLARTTVLSSSNSDAEVDWDAGDKDVFLTVPAERFGDDTAYSYFPVWAEESSTISAGATEYAYGNGDDTPLASGIVIGIDCELYAAGGEAEASTGVNLEVIKNGSSVAETGVFSSNTVVGVTPVSYSAGDIVNFRTKAVTTSGASCRPVAWFRVPIQAPKGDKGDAGAPGDLDWQGEWSAGTYTEFETVEHSGSSYVCTASSTTETPSTSAADWDLVAEKGDTGSSGGTLPYMHLALTTAQNHGGADGTVVYVDWDGSEIHKDTGFTHSTGTNPSRVQVDADGRYSLYFNIQGTQGGSARTTWMSHYRVNGSTVVIRGRQRNYSRGSAYGDLGVGMTTELDLTNGDYIEAGTTVDDTDATYTINSIPAECELIIRKLA